MKQCKKGNHWFIWIKKERSRKRIGRVRSTLFTRRLLGRVTKITGILNPREQSHSTRAAIFNLDSMPIMVDDGASVCITNAMEDFIGKARCIDQKVTGIAGNAQATCQGTIHWHIEDDDRVQHTLKIK